MLSSGASTRLIVDPGSPGCFPGRRFPRSRSDDHHSGQPISNLPRRVASTRHTRPGHPAQGVSMT
jgi:hypothetical protein